MDKIKNIINNPVVMTAINSSSPQLYVALNVLYSIFAKDPPNVNTLVKVIDDKLNHILKELAEKQPLFYKRELEIRAHQLLEVLVLWNDKQ